MHFKISLLVLPLSFICITFSCYGQISSTNIDSLLQITLKEAKPDRTTIKRYHEAASYYWRLNPDSSSFFAEKAISLSEEIQDNALLGISIYLKANIALDKQENVAARLAYQRSLDLYKDSKDFVFLTKLHTNLGTTFSNENNYEEASKAYNEAKHYAKFTEDNNIIAMVLGNQGIVASMRGDNRLAIALYSEALKTFEAAKNLPKIAALRHNIGSLYSNLGENGLAVTYTKLAAEAYEQAGNHKSLISARLNLCYYYKELGQLDSADYVLQEVAKSPFALNNPQIALKFLLAGQIAHEKKNYLHARIQLDSSLAYANMAENPLSIHNAHTQLATVLLALNKSAEALHYAKLALASAKEMQDATSINADEIVLAKAYAAQGRYQEAYTYLLAHQEGKDTILNQQRIDAIRQVEVKYETEKKDQLIQQQKQELKNRNVLLLIALTMLIVAGAAVYYLIKARRHALEINTILEERFETLKSQNKHLNPANEITTDSNQGLEPSKAIALPKVIRLNSGQVVKLDDISYIQASGNGIEIYLLDGTRIHEWQKLKQIKELLTEELGFLQIHRSYLVNMIHIYQVTAAQVQIKPNTNLPIGITQKPSILQRFKVK